MAYQLTAVVVFGKQSAFLGIGVSASYKGYRQVSHCGLNPGGGDFCD